MIRFFCGFCSFIVTAFVTVQWWTMVRNDFVEVLSSTNAVMVIVTSAALWVSCDYMSDAAQQMRARHNPR